MGRSSLVACSHFPADAKASHPLVCLHVVPVLDLLLIIYSTDGSAPRVQNTKRNMKAFGSRVNAPPAALWYDKQFPPFVDFDQESKCPCFDSFSLICLTLFSIVPIYDASSRTFAFSDEDFVGLPSLPRFKKHGDPKHADLPPNALVTVFFTMNTYTSSRAPPTPGSVRTLTRTDDHVSVASGSSLRDNPVAHGDNARFGSSQVLSPNLQFLIYHGLIPDDD